ncbi:hypothetical protein R1sor_008233 [Riccia sorocarpa]|uniref:Uncharacterized protein n=1 Tax=Riccia sorocarpa TaxID=122646 RepID=A0ABD3HVN3_9MARC
MRLRKKTAEIRYSEESKTPNRTSNWNWKNFVKDTNWFATMCNLPSPPGGLIPMELPETAGSSLLQNLRSLFKFLKKAWSSGRPPPHGPPLLRVPIWYNRPPPLNFNLNAIDGFVLKETLVGSAPPADAATGCDTSIEVIECNLSPKVAYSCSSLKSDAAADIQRCSNPIERRDPSHNHEPDHAPGVNSEHTAHAENFKTEAPRQNTENLRTEALAGTTYNQSLISMLTPERLQLEILSLTRQQQKLQDDISILRSILEMSNTALTSRQVKFLHAMGATVRNSSLFLEKMQLNERKEAEAKEMMEGMEERELQEFIDFYRMMIDAASSVLQQRRNSNSSRNF